jgi:hypothetical protein
MRKAPGTVWLRCSTHWEPSGAPMVRLALPHRVEAERKLRRGHCWTRPTNCEGRAACVMWGELRQRARQNERAHPACTPCSTPTGPRAAKKPRLERERHALQGRRLGGGQWRHHPPRAPGPPRGSPQQQPAIWPAGTWACARHRPPFAQRGLPGQQAANWTAASTTARWPLAAAVSCRNSEGLTQGRRNTARRASLQGTGRSKAHVTGLQNIIQTSAWGAQVLPRLGSSKQRRQSAAWG